MARETMETTEENRNRAAIGAVGFAALTLGYAAGTGPLEERPELPLGSANLAALAVLHERVPEASRTNGLVALKEERVDLLKGISCRDGSKLTDLSNWSHDRAATGSQDHPYRTDLTWRTGFKCGDKAWGLEGTGADLELTTDRGLWGGDWDYKVDSFAEATVSRTTGLAQ